jgi:hypothetical protein
LAKRKNRSVTIVAVARKMVTIAFLRLKNSEPYRYALPELMREKFSGLKTLAKGPKAKVGSRKPGLADIYQSTKLPRVRIPNQLQQMLENRKLRQFVQDLHISPLARPAPTSDASPGRPTGRPKRP